MAGDLKQYVEALRDLEDTKTELSGMIKAVEEKSAKVKTSIINYLTGQGQQSAKFPGVGAVTLVKKETVFLSDPELVCRYMYENMDKAARAGEPLSNHLVLQKRALQGEMLKITRDELKAAGIEATYQTLNDALNKVGFTYRDEPTLSLRRA
jgi:hypothetical protein